MKGLVVMGWGVSKLGGGPEDDREWLVSWIFQDEQKSSGDWGAGGRGESELTKTLNQENDNALFRTREAQQKITLREGGDYIH